MRILSVGNLYPPHHFGGYELIWRGAVEQLREAGHEVRILTTDHRHPSPDPAIPEDPDCHRELRWYWRDHAFPRLGAARAAAARAPQRGRSCERHLDEWSPDLVAWWPMGGMSLSLLERVHRAGLPSVADRDGRLADLRPARSTAWQAPLCASARGSAGSSSG